MVEITKSIDNGRYNTTLNGKFTFFDHAAFREVIDQMSHANIKKIVLHMAGVSFIDSAALGMLLLARDEAEQHRKPLIISGITGQVKKMFDTARFDTLFTLEDDS